MDSYSALANLGSHLKIRVFPRLNGDLDLGFSLGRPWRSWAAALAAHIRGMADMTPDQIAQREAARTRTGEFGTHDRTDPEIDLGGGNAYNDVTAPVTVKVHLEQWHEDAYVVTVGAVDFDARALLDAEPLRELENTGSDTDWVFERAQTLGLVDGHDGPFTVELPDDFEDYITHRENNGMVDAYELAHESIALQQAEVATKRRADALEEADRQLSIAGTDPKTNDELTPGDVLVSGKHRLTIDNIERSSTMPGMLAVETEFGTLYLDPAETSQVEREF
jgi:hypothetical protein